MIRVRKDGRETLVTEKSLPLYFRQGWEQVDEKKPEKPKTYDKYTKKQLVAIAKNRNIYTRANARKQEIIDKLLASEQEVKDKPKKFNDNLINE